MERRKKNLIKWVIGIFILAFVFIFWKSCDNENPFVDKDRENYDLGLKYLDQKKYLEASSKFSAVTNYTEYPNIRSLLKSADSLYSIKREADRAEEIEAVKNSLRKEIKSDVFTKGFSSKYRGAIKSLQMELVVFGAWKLTIENAALHDDPEINKLGKTLRSKVIAFQKKEFPILRKEYAKLAGQVLWEDNIEVVVKGSKNSVLEFTGGMFAANKNIKNTQETLTDQMEMFRFKRTEYKWMEYASEYTYYTLTTPDDGALYAP